MIRKRGLQGRSLPNCCALKLGKGIQGIFKITAGGEERTCNPTRLRSKDHEERECLGLDQ